jgi:hypothetical protein
MVCVLASVTAGSKSQTVGLRRIVDSVGLRHSPEGRAEELAVLVEGFET